MRRAQILSLATIGIIALATFHFVRRPSPQLEAEVTPARFERSPRGDAPEPVSQASSLANVADAGAANPVAQPARVNRSLPACGPGDEEVVGECLGQFLSMQFDSERRDDAWADATERTIVNGLTEISTVTRVASLTVECRETVCRLQMAFPAIEYVPTKGPQERDAALVSTVFGPMLATAGLRRLIVPYPRTVDYAERTYYFAR